MAVLCNWDQSGSFLNSGLGFTATYKLCSCAHSTTASPDGPMMAPLLPKSVVQFGTIVTFTSDLPLLKLSVAAREYLPRVDPRHDMTFKVECTRLTYLLTLPALFSGGTCPGVPRSHQARGPCSLTVAERRYLPGSDRRGIHVVLPSERCSAASLSFAPLLSFYVPLLSLLPWSSNALYLASLWW